MWRYEGTALITLYSTEFVKQPHFAVFQWLLDFVCYWINQSINHILLFSSDLWILCAIESINRSINQAINQSSNQSIEQSINYTLLFSSDFWILCAIESINQSIEQAGVDERNILIDLAPKLFGTRIFSNLPVSRMSGLGSSFTRRIEFVSLYLMNSVYIVSNVERRFHGVTCILWP